MVKQFRGQVRIEDVQEEFDNLLIRTNTLVDAYNKSVEYQDLDYTGGGSSLAPNGYTLTVGGLKQAMKAMDGYVIGAKPVRISSTQVKITDGLLVTTNGFYRLPQTVVEPSNNKRLYFNIVSQQYQWNPEGEQEVVVPIKTQWGKNIYQFSTYNDDYEPYAWYNGEKVYQMNSTAYNYPNSIYRPVYFNSKNNLIIEKYESNGNNQADIDNRGGKSIITDIANLPYMTAPIRNGYTIRTPYSDYLWGQTLLVLANYNPMTQELTPKIAIAWTDTNWYKSYGFTCYTLGKCTRNVDNNDKPYFEFKSTYFGEVGIDRTDDYSDLSGVDFKFEYDDLTGKDAIVMSYKENTDNRAVKLQLPANIESYDVNVVLVSQYGDQYNENNTTVDTTTYITNGFFGDLYQIVDSNNNIVSKLSDTENEVTTFGRQTIIGADAGYKICDINMKRDSIVCSDLLGAQVENVSGTFKITTESKWKKPVCQDAQPDPIDTSENGIFAALLENYTEGRSFFQGFLFDTLVSRNRKTGHRKLDVWSPITKLFIPKGCDSPITYGATNQAATKVFKAIFKKNIKQSENE